MNAFMSELGKKLADRWATNIALPGLLFVATAAAGVTLGHWHAFDGGALIRWVDRISRTPAAHTAAVVLLVAVLAVLAASAAGLVVEALAFAAGQWYTFAGAHWLVRWRRNRWQRANGLVQMAMAEAARDPGRIHPPLRTTILARDRIALREPQRPTWIADRFLATDQRLQTAYDLDLTAVWPHVWLVVPDHVRAELTTAQDAYTSALRLSGWAMLYVALAAWWWPSALVGIVVMGLAWRRSRLRAAILAGLIESTVDLYCRDVATRLGLPINGELTKDVGLAITSALRKDAPPEFDLDLSSDQTRIRE